MKQLEVVDSREQIINIEENKSDRTVSDKGNVIN